MYQRILIATDGSELSDKAVNSGLALAKLSGATVIALSVVAHYPRSYMEGSATLDVNEVARIEGQWRAVAQKKLDAVTDKARDWKVPVQTVVATSDLVAETIIATARETHCDLIVMASHGHKGLKRILLGSETQHVLTHSTLPVLVLR